MSKTVLVTGGTSGVGEATVKILAQQGNQILLLARNQQKAEKVIEKYGGDIKFYQADLADLNSVAKAADEILKNEKSLDTIINNAGGIFNTKELTKDGLEWGFQVNHLSHYLLTRNLTALLLKSKEPKVINLSSEAHQMGKYEPDNLNGERKFSGWKQYGATKLMNILFTKSLKDHYENEGINAYAVHPGVVKTNFGKNNGGWLKFFSWMPFLITPEEGAATSIYLATTPAQKLTNGFYYKKSKPVQVSKAAINRENRDDLWKQSEYILKQKGFKI